MYNIPWTYLVSCQNTLIICVSLLDPVIPLYINPIPNNNKIDDKKYLTYLFLFSFTIYLIINNKDNLIKIHINHNGCIFIYILYNKFNILLMSLTFVPTCFLVYFN